jgi:hypothetical protein
MPAGTESVRATDFSRSFCYYIPQSTPIWVRMQIECRCELFDRTLGTATADEYLLTVRTQTGLRTKPVSATLDPGYDFWMIFSSREIFVRRTHASAYNNNPSRAELTEFVASGWHLHSCPATPLLAGASIRAALQEWKPVVARSTFMSPEGDRGWVIEYPVKWADGNPDDTFRVETGPVLLLTPEREQAGKPLTFDDFQWAYLDYHSFDRVRCFLERPTSIFSGAAYQGSSRTRCRHPTLTEEQVAAIEERLYTGWEPPVPVDELKPLFRTDHYSAVVELPVTTELFALADS